MHPDRTETNSARRQGQLRPARKSSLPGGLRVSPAFITQPKTPMKQRLEERSSWGRSASLLAHRRRPLPAQPTAMPFGQTKKRADFLQRQLWHGRRRQRHGAKNGSTLDPPASIPAPTLWQSDSQTLAHAAARILNQPSDSPPARLGAFFWPSGAATKGQPDSRRTASRRNERKRTVLFH